jgi:hypothetical protein
MDSEFEFSGIKFDFRGGAIWVPEFGFPQMLLWLPRAALSQPPARALRAVAGLSQVRWAISRANNVVPWIL